MSNSTNDNRGRRHAPPSHETLVPIAIGLLSLMLVALLLLVAGLALRALPSQIAFEGDREGLYLQVGLPLAAALTSFSFAGMVLMRWFRRRARHNLAWGLGLLLFGTGALMEVAYQTFGWSAVVFRLWYLSGAFFAAAYLGQGTIYLLAKQRYADALMGGLVAGSAFAVFLVFSAPLQPEAVQDFGELTGRALPEYARLFTIPFNTYGTLGLVGGAIYSTWLFWRKRVLLNRVVGNLLIALGGMLPAFAGVMSRLGIPRALYVGLFLGSVLMFLGYLRASRPQDVAQAKQTQA